MYIHVYLFTAPIASHLLWLTCFFDPYFFQKQILNFRDAAELKCLAYFNFLCGIKQDSAPEAWWQQLG